MASSITVTDSEITVLELSVTNKDSAAFLLRVPEVDRVPVLQKAIEVGLF